jgi:hypothetical protein
MMPKIRFVHPYESILGSLRIMISRFSIGLKLATLFGVLVVGPLTARGSDPNVRLRLRNIDENHTALQSAPSLQGVPTLQNTMDQLQRGELSLPIELDRLFGETSFEPPQEFRGAEVRRWQDNTGAYEVQGRLAIIYPDKVKILKPNGRTTTVSMRRLSSSDQAYVRWVAEQLTQTGVGPYTANQADVAEYPSR